MKKIQFLAMIAATTLACVSCSNDEVLMQSPDVDKPIEFGSYVGRNAVTRAHSVENPATLATDGGFGVFAYYTNGVNYNATATPNFMYNQHVEGVTSAGVTTWAYNPLKYWPNEANDNLTFFAYAPYADHTVTTDNFEFTANTAAGDPVITYTVNEEVQDQEDLLYGVRVSDGLPYIDLNRMVNNVDIEDNVTFHFRHALSRIGFNVQAMIDNVNEDNTGTADDAIDASEVIHSATNIAVTKVELIGKFRENGELNLNNTGKAHAPNWDATPTTLTERTFTLDANDFVTAVADAVTTGKQQLNNENAWVMVIPQDLNTDMINIRVTYTVTTTDANLDGGESVVENVIESGYFAFNFEHGMSYMFNLHLGLTSVKFDATVNGWDDGSETAVNVPINAEP